MSVTKPSTLMIAAVLGLAAVRLSASGQAGIYGIVERVVLEPNGGPPDRIQVWGAFALIERSVQAFQGIPMTEVQGQYFTNYVYQKPTRGYLYFKRPEAAAEIENARREWADLAAVAGTRQAIAFGYWDRLRGARLMRVRDAAAKPEDPDVYYTDVGIAKLGPNGNHASIVADLLRLVPR